MSQTIGYIALVVRDYDEAIAFYTEKLSFTLIEDKPIENKRWVLVAPRGRNSPCLLLARAATPEQQSRVGNQTGGRVFLFLHTDVFLARLSRPDRARRALRTTAEGGKLRHRSGVRRPLREPVGSPATARAIAVRGLTREWFNVRPEEYPKGIKSFSPAQRLRGMNCPGNSSEVIHNLNGVVTNMGAMTERNRPQPPWGW